MSTKLAILGAKGRMGSAVARLASGHDLTVVAAIDTGDDLATLVSSGAEVVVDFSTPAAFTKACVVLESAPHPIAFVSGTTGLDEDARATLDRLGNKAPVLWEPNMSVGVHVLATLVERALAALGPGYDVEVVEAHHRMKVDAPSGTALRLAEVVKAGRTPRARYVHGREGKPGARDKDEIGMHALRGGDVIGDHTVYFFGDGERIELTHRASSRDLFAHGALRAAKWVAGKPAGRYRLADVIG
jgi:4-hydroxy-tetrahydrodipicolinate reductase